MQLNDVRRVSSAGYRLPERPTTTRPTDAPGSVQKPPGKTRNSRGESVSGQRPDTSDPLKEQIWREFVQKEMRGVREWEKNWGFLKNYDQLGNLKAEEPLPSYVPLFSDQLPNTTNQMIGSRVSTPLGRELIMMDRQLLWARSHHKTKVDPDMFPS